MDYLKFEEAFNRFPVTASNQDPLNQKLLEMLSVYDSDCRQPDALLACAAILARKLYEFDSSSEINFINMIQTFKRKRDLYEDEMNGLRNITIDSTMMTFKAAAYALLDESEMAALCLARCSEEDQIQLKEYPIGKFFK